MIHMPSDIKALPRLSMQLMINAAAPERRQRRSTLYPQAHAQKPDQMGMLPAAHGHTFCSHLIHLRLSLRTKVWKHSLRMMRIQWINIEV